MEKTNPSEHHEAVSPESSVVAEDDSGVPPGYWKSYRFIGSMGAIILLANNTFIAYSMPVSAHTITDIVRKSLTEVGQRPGRHQR